MSLECEHFVLSDNGHCATILDRISLDFEKHGRPLHVISVEHDFLHFRSGRKTALLLLGDNNHVSERLLCSGLKVHHFVGICDGCCEGGNYECVNERPFLRRLMRIAVDGMRYSIDHSIPLQGLNQPYGWGGSNRRRFRDSMALRDFPPPSRDCGSEWPEVLQDQVPDATFELQGVLVRTDDAAGHLAVLPKAIMAATQLDALKPFRDIARRGILAEYRVLVDHDHSERGYRC